MNPTLHLATVLASTLAQDAEPQRFPVSIHPLAMIRLEASWEPVAEWALGTPEVVEHPLLTGIAPAEREREIGADLLRPYLPAGPVAIGEAWEVRRDAVVPLLSQLHPGATADLARGMQSAPGSHALLRAVGERHLELLTRSHASFVLKGDVRLNPAQFEGRLLLDRESGAVVAYRLHLPSRNTNLDVNVPLNPDAERFQRQVRIDLGHVPRMELSGGAWPQGIAWRHEVADDVARRTLRDRFYGPIDWLPFEEAAERARREDEPLHLVVVFGTFDDESC